MHKPSGFLCDIELSRELVLEQFALQSKQTRQQLEANLALAFITGSGLNSSVAGLRQIASIDYSDLPCMLECTAHSHQGKLKLYQHSQSYLLVFHGRFHLYEGRTARQVSTPVYLAKLLGIKELVISNAAGALNAEFKTGSLMLLEDHINFTGHSPLIGESPLIGNDTEIDNRFPDMSQAYDHTLRVRAAQIAKQQNIDCSQGIYVGVTGPNLETSAERRFFRSAGGDVVGMSTVLENIAANHCGIKVLGISAITNAATGGAEQQVDTIEAVLEQAEICATKINLILRALLS